MDPATTPPPPGRSGWPLLGETLPFLADPFGFIAGRIAAHGPVFRTHLLGRNAVVMAGPEACVRWIDPLLVERAGAMPPNIARLFGGRSLPLLDGDEHRERKGLVLAGFSRESLASYLPGLERTVTAYFARWVEQRRLPWVEDLKRLAIAAICVNTMGMEPGPALDRLLAEYDVMGRGFTCLPIPLPGTTHSRAMAALDRILATLEEAARQHLARPGDDGLSRILAARTAGGRGLTLDEAKRELHHIVVAGLIIWAELAAAAMLLDQHPDARARLQGEVKQHAPAGALTLETLERMPYLARVVMEVKRLCPIIPAQFGKARQAFAVHGHAVPAGWMVLWAVHATNVDPLCFTDPHRFDPDRFAPGRAEHERHPHAFVPQGPGPALGHRCPGIDYATLFMQVFLVHLLRAHSFRFPPQDLSYRFKLIPPEPKDGLQVEIGRTSSTD